MENTYRVSGNISASEQNQLWAALPVLICGTGEDLNTEVVV